MNPVIRAPRGTEMSCQGWPQEAALRMLMNNLDPDVAERPQDLVVYGGTGRAARSWDAFHVICRELRRLGHDETLLVQSGKAVGVVKTHDEAPRVIIANANLVPAWANFDEFNRLEAAGLTMYGQMTAGSWIYIGTQGILQGTYETFVAAAHAHFGTDNLAGRLVLSAGLGGMGGAQPLAVTLAGGVFLGVEVDPTRIRRRLETRYLDEVADNLDDALARAATWQKKREPRSIALCANAADVFAELARRGFVPDLTTDQTSAHDPLGGYIPQGLDVAGAADLRARDPEEYVRQARASMAVHCRAMIDLLRQGSHVFDYGNNLRGQAKLAGVEDAFVYPGFVPAYIRPLFCRGKGPFRWAALSGDPADIHATDEAVRAEIGKDQDPALHRWLDLARERVAFQGLPARICWLGYGERDRVGARFNELVSNGKVKAPIVIGRDHLDSGSVASPYRETEAMKDGSDAIADWPILNALVNTAAGATWVSFHHGGGVGIGYSLHAGMVVVADGTERAARCLQRVLTTDPAMGVFRHADAGYEDAQQFAAEAGVVVPHAPEVVTLVVENTAAIMTCDPGLAGLGLIPRAHLAIRDGKIVHVGADLPAEFGDWPRLDAGGRLVTPGLVDVHAHPIFGGDRAGEFALRAAGKGYLEIAAAGGGIVSTVRATRAASDDDLIAGTRARLMRALSFGTTTCEAKTGYALDVDGEIRLLRLLARVAGEVPVTLSPTLLGAHAVPPGVDRDEYVAACAGPMLDRAQGLARAVDVYCDEGAFTLDETRAILGAARGRGFAVRAHAGQFADLGAAGLVAELGGLSADHLEHVSDAQAEQMAAAGTVATLLWGACIQLRCPAPPVARLRRAGCAIALGTDMNPGSSMTASLPLQMWLACTHGGMTVDEAWLGVTRHAARAVGRPEAGMLVVGAPADLVVWNADAPATIPYHYGMNHVERVVVRGVVTGIPVQI